MRFPTAILFLGLLVSAVTSAQTPAAARPPETAREALIEMINGGQKGVMKHLTVEVQDLLNKKENKQGAAMLATFDLVQHQSGADMQTFPTGSTLLTINHSAHRKLEVYVDNDDLSGDQDILQLSMHFLRDGQETKEQEGEDEWALMSSHITVTMKKQQDIWRLSNVGVGIELPLGDPEFLQKTFLKAAGGGSVGVAAPSVHAGTKEEKPKAFDPSGTVTMLGYSESAFARQHPDIGFTCSLPELAEAGKAFGLDAQLASGSYSGYKWSVSGCEGKPAGSFQIVAEPIIQGRGTKAVCTDATQNLRTSDDGRGSTCLTAGRGNAIQDQTEDGGMVGIKLPVESDKPKP